MFQPGQEAPGSETAGRALQRGGPGDTGSRCRRQGLEGAGLGSRLSAVGWGPGPIEAGGGGGEFKRMDRKKDAWGDGRGKKRKVIKRTLELQSIKLLA